MEKLADYKDSLLALIESEKTVFLSTIDAEGYPSTRAMLNLKNPSLYPHLKELYDKEENPFTIYLSTNTSSLKMTEIVVNDKVCLYYFDPANYLGITLRGKVEIINDNDFKKKAWTQGWEASYPGGPESADYTILRFIPDKLKSFGDLDKQKSAKE